VSLDLRAAFDTIDHAVLLKRLNCSFGITSTVHSWLQSYLSGRTQSVRISTHTSPPTSSPVAVPQGSVLGPLLFSVYTSPISTNARSHHVSQQQYADDTQLFLALSPANHSQSINVLQSCPNSLHIWFCENGMALNPNKSVAILFGTSQRLKFLSGFQSVNIVGAVIPLSDNVKILRATLATSCNITNPRGL